jgi:tubulin--tyrosine ligase
MPNSPTIQDLQGKKFHLRAYCVAEGALNVYLFPKLLALFSSVPYSRPLPAGEDETTIDLRAHLTNSALQTVLGEENVRLLTELIGSTILSGAERRKFTEEDATRLIDQVGLVLGEVFKPGLGSAIHFQARSGYARLFLAIADSST